MITGTRLQNQGLTTGRFTKPEDVVRWLGAVQAQEYPGAKWALAMRMRRGSDGAIERAFTSGRILRTHVLRPTWHFVTPRDIRWMLALTGPRVKRAMASYDRKLGLDEAVYRKSRTAIEKALRGGTQLTRTELQTAMRQAGIHTDGVQRLAHLVMRAELDAVVCSGARRGNQFTYALLDDRVPASPALSREEALAELTLRYFTGHGPAQTQDFGWWSGLTAADVRAGLALAAPRLASEVIDGKTYWFSPTTRPVPRVARTAYLLPLYDEYLIAYKDRSAALDPARWKRVVTSRDPFASPIVFGGHVVGGWKRALEKTRVVVTLTPFRPFSKADARAIAAAAADYARFLGLDLHLA